MSKIFELFIKPRPAPIANEYVLNSSKMSDAGEYTLAYKLQNSKEHFSPIQVAAECMDHLAAGIGKPHNTHTILLFPYMEAESIEAVSGAVITPLSLCLRSQDSSEALRSFTLFPILQC